MTNLEKLCAPLEDEAVKCWNSRPREEKLKDIYKQLLAGINACIEGNLHLADGDNCTLMDLKKALVHTEQLAGE